MPYTIEEAQANKDRIISEKAIEQNMKEDFPKENFLKEAIICIDKEIAKNIDEILMKPIRASFDLPINLARLYQEEINDIYKDFSIYFSNWSKGMSIKLKDKDWDWGGYGVKEVKEESPLGRYAVNSPSALSKAKQMVRDWFSCK